MKRILFILLAFAFACQNNTNVDPMNQIAEKYVKLVLKVGQYDPLFVDAYYGPEEWKPEELSEEEKRNIPKEDLLKETESLLASLSEIDLANLKELELLRHRYLVKQINAVKGRIQMVSGEKVSFDKETTILYDAKSPELSLEHFDELLVKLEEKLPGEGDLGERLQEFKNQFLIPQDKVEAVFEAAINEARKRTLDKIELPENENFEVSYVTDKPWAAYNWYKGNNFSLIEVNVEYPILIDRAIDLASHEGYPGHHVYNSLLETKLVREKGWVEFSVYPLYSPQSLIAEGTANYGIEMVFPFAERLKFEKEVLFPMAGLDPEKAELYYEVLDIVSGLSYVRNIAAKAFLDGDMTKEETIDWLVKYNLRSKGSAEQSLRFIETYRSYLINYNVGLDIVSNYIDRQAGQNIEKRWETFNFLLSTPQIPSELSK